MKTPTPKRSVEEIVEEIDSQIVCDELQHSSLRWLLKQILQTERQRCDEVVEATVAKAIELTKQNVPYVTGDQDRLIAELKALTQPNNQDSV